jgi:hypothetical protein
MYDSGKILKLWKIKCGHAEHHNWEIISQVFESERHHKLCESYDFGCWEILQQYIRVLEKKTE